MPLILEGIVTSLNADGSPNVAPMGPIVERRDGRRIERLIFRPFPGSTTFENLKAQRQGVFHLTDRVLLFAQAVTRQLNFRDEDFRPADHVTGLRLMQTCSWHEFRIREVDETGERMVLTAEVIHSGFSEPWLGLNRAQFAVIEAAILATRLFLFESTVVAQKLDELAVLVEKTGDQEQHRAFALISEFIEKQSPQSATNDSWQAGSKLRGQT